MACLHRSNLSTSAVEENSVQSPGSFIALFLWTLPKAKAFDKLCGSCHESCNETIICTGQVSWWENENPSVEGKTDHATSQERIISPPCACGNPSSFFFSSFWDKNNNCSCIEKDSFWHCLWRHGHKRMMMTMTLKVMRATVMALTLKSLDNQRSRWFASPIARAWIGQFHQIP